MRAVGFGAFVATSSVALAALAQDPSAPTGAELPTALAPIQGPESNAAPPRYRRNPRGYARTRLAQPSPPVVGRELPYHPGDDIPPGYRLGSRVFRGPIKAGAAMFLPTYAFNVGMAVSSDGYLNWMYVPGVGAWPYVGELCEPSTLTGTEWACGWMVLHSAAHSVGLGLIVSGILFRRPILVRTNQTVMVLPARIGSGNGLELRGRF